jgi:hypothetical protein
MLQDNGAYAFLSQDRRPDIWIENKYDEKSFYGSYKL